MGEASNDGDNMHRHVGWMVAADVSILKFLHSARTPRGGFAIQTPNTIAANTGYSNRHVSARCQDLEQRGLIERTEKAKYRLTELGADAITDEISIEELRERTGDVDDSEDSRENSP